MLIMINYYKKNMDEYKYTIDNKNKLTLDHYHHGLVRFSLGAYDNPSKSATLDYERFHNKEWKVVDKVKLENKNEYKELKDYGKVRMLDYHIKQDHGILLTIGVVVKNADYDKCINCKKNNDLIYDFDTKKTLCIKCYLK